MPDLPIYSLGPQDSSTPQEPTNIFIFTSTDTAAQKNLSKSIHNSIDENIIKEFLTEEQISLLKDTAGGFYAWGARPRDKNVPIWKAMNQGDLVINYNEKHYRNWSFLIFKIHHPALARTLWGENEVGETWEYMYFLTKPLELVPPIHIDLLKDYLNSGYMGFTRIGDKKLQKIKEDFGSITNFMRKSFNIDLSYSIVPSLSKTQFTEPISDNRLQMLTAIRTKPFIILAGFSGTGKSKEVRELAYLFCTQDLRAPNNGKPGNFAMIKVKPNWHDSTEILGYESRISGKDKYIITEFIRFLIKALKYPNTPFFLCLDEMNLAPVEQYLAEYLSVLETRRVVNGKIVSDPLISRDIFRDHDNELIFWSDLGITSNDVALQNQLKINGLILPSNLILMGTVNMDETAHSFSRKVLDRAMTIEMNSIDFDRGLTFSEFGWTYPNDPYDKILLLGDRTIAAHAVTHLKEEQKKRVLDFLEDINVILNDSSFKIAYRVRDEFLIYVSYYLGLDKPIEEALDVMTIMKILTRIEGDASKTKEILERLREALPPIPYPFCAAKLIEMELRLERQYYTSFWNN